MSVQVDQPILFRTWKIGFERSAGTGFLIELNSRCFLVTASHVVVGLESGNNLAVRHDGQWLLVGVRGIKRSRPEFDVSVIDLDIPLSDAISRERLGCDFQQGQEISFCGFPLDFEIEDIPQTNGYPIPLVKGGLISGMLKVPDDRKRRLLFDAQVNKGFSGGPILVKSDQTNLCTVIAVVTHFEPDHEFPVIQKLPDGGERRVPHHFVRGNSGFLRGSPISIALELAEEFEQA